LYCAREDTSTACGVASHSAPCRPPHRHFRISPRSADADTWSPLCLIRCPTLLPHLLKLLRRNAAGVPESLETFLFGTQMTKKGGAGRGSMRYRRREVRTWRRGRRGGRMARRVVSRGRRHSRPLPDVYLSRTSCSSLAPLSSRFPLEYHMPRPRRPRAAHLVIAVQKAPAQTPARTMSRTQSR
jgi:hypothetical protein